MKLSELCWTYYGGFNAVNIARVKSTRSPAEWSVYDYAPQGSNIIRVFTENDEACDDFFGGELTPLELACFLADKEPT